MTIDLPGGALDVELSADLSRAAIVGPAVEVYRGELDYR